MYVHSKKYLCRLEIVIRILCKHGSLANVGCTPRFDNFFHMLHVHDVVQISWWSDIFSVSVFIWIGCDPQATRFHLDQVLSALCSSYAHNSVSGYSVEPAVGGQ